VTKSAAIILAESGSPDVPLIRSKVLGTKIPKFPAPSPKFPARAEKFPAPLSREFEAII
jgi:hypothetical protein